jgi:very-short-patch-repair endonuclease
VFPGVYAVGHPRRAPEDLAMAAVLACGPRAVLSHLSAAALWGFIERWPEKFDVSAPRDRRPKGIRTHWRKLGPGDKTRQLGVPVTSPGLTVLDCAPIVGPRLTRFVNDALLSLSLGPNALAETFERHPHHPGSRLVREILLGQRGVTRSELEDKFVRFLKRFDIQQPELNVPMYGRVVDAFFREEGVIVELDGYESHKDRVTFERDREKDADAAADGLATVRITEQRMDHAGEQEARRLKTILRLRRKSR